MPRASGPVATVGLALLCVVYAWVGAAVLWYQGAGLVRALVLAGAWAGVTIIATIVFLGRQRSPGDENARSRRVGPVRAAALVHLSLLVAAGAAVVAWPLIRSADWGEPGDRVTSPDGRLVAVTYEWTAMIDPGWNIAVERVDGSGRQWFWRGTEHPAPTEVRFLDAHRVEVVDDVGQAWVVDLDPETLEPSERYCTNTSYCYQWPWDGYTRTTPAPS